MSRRLLAALGAVVIGLGLAVPSAHAGPSPTPHFTALHPGDPTLRTVPIHVNLVVVGYPTGSLDLARLVASLPTHGVPLEVGPALRGRGFAVGSQLRYRYHLVVAGAAFDDAFFSHLARSGTVGPPDAYQQRYDAQISRSLTVGPAVRYLDAAETEAWLERHAADSLGLNPHDDTAFLVDWYGRPDFQFHTYTNVGTPDPDTGVNPRATLAATHVRAWGGSSGTSWFYDLSAGPVWSDGSFDVDDANVTGTTGTDYRLPPIWDYGHVGYRPFDDLTGDLAKVVRYAAIDDVFAASPVYDPMVTQPLPGGGKQVALDVFEGAPGVNGLDHLHADQVLTQLQRVEPYVPISMAVRDLPLAGGALDAYEIGTFASDAPDCWSPFGFREIELECYFLGHYPTYFPPPSAGGTVMPELGFTVADDPSTRSGFAGLTDDDFSTGTPELVTMFDDAPQRASAKAIGYTVLTTHETGHFLGLSHPHDGMDPEQELIYGPHGDFFVAWTGDQSASVMSYLPGNTSFDAFDVDNLSRNLYARLSVAADYFAGVLLAQPDNATVDRLLTTADTQFHAADLAVQAERWVDAAADSYAGFTDIARALQVDGLLPPSTATSRVAARMLTGGARAWGRLPQVHVARAVHLSPGVRRCVLREVCPAPRH